MFLRKHSTTQGIASVDMVDYLINPSSRENPVGILARHVGDKVGGYVCFAFTAFSALKNTARVCVCTYVRWWYLQISFSTHTLPRKVNRKRKDGGVSKSRRRGNGRSLYPKPAYFPEKKVPLCIHSNCLLFSSRQLWGSLGTRLCGY